MPETDSGSLWVGVLIGIVLTGLGLGAAFAFMTVSGTVALVLLGGIGVAQALWIMPAFLYFYRRGQRETGKGILIIAGICLLLNASCWGLFASGRFKIGG